MWRRRAQGATHFACPGGCIGYRADPVPALDLWRSLPYLLMIRGNDDQAPFRNVDLGMAGLRAALDRTSAQLTPARAAGGGALMRRRWAKRPARTPAPTIRRRGNTCASRNRSMPAGGHPGTRYLVLPGEPVRTLPGYAHRYLVDHIIIGVRGGPVLRGRLGSASAAVAAQVPCTVTEVRTCKDIARR